MKTGDKTTTGPTNYTARTDVPGNNQVAASNTSEAEASTPAPVVASNPSTNPASVNRAIRFQRVSPPATPGSSRQESENLPEELKSGGRQDQSLSLDAIAGLPRRRAGAMAVPHRPKVVGPPVDDPDMAITPAPLPVTAEAVEATTLAEAEEVRKAVEDLGPEFEGAPTLEPGDTTTSYANKVMSYLADLREKNPKIDAAIKKSGEFQKALRDEAGPHLNNVWQITKNNAITVPLQVWAREGFISLTQKSSLNWSKELRDGLAIGAGTTTIGLVLGSAVVRHLRGVDTPASLVGDIAAACMTAIPLYLAAKEGVAGNALEGIGKSYFITLLRDMTAVFHRVVKSNVNDPKGLLKIGLQVGLLSLVYGGAQGGMGAIEGLRLSHSGTNTDFDGQGSGELAGALFNYALTVMVPEILFDIAELYSDAALYGAGEGDNKQTGLAGMRQARVETGWQLHDPNPDPEKAKTIAQRIGDRFDKAMISRLATLGGLYTTDVVLREGAARAGDSVKATAGRALGVESGAVLGPAGGLLFKSRFILSEPRKRRAGNVEDGASGGGGTNPGGASNSQVAPMTIQAATDTAEVGDEEQVDLSTTNVIDFANLTDGQAAAGLANLGITPENARAVLSTVIDDPQSPVLDQSVIMLSNLQSANVQSEDDDMYGAPSTNPSISTTAPTQPASNSDATSDPSATVRRSNRPATSSALNLSQSSTAARGGFQSGRPRDQLGTSVGPKVDAIESRVRRGRGGRGGGTS